MQLVILIYHISGASAVSPEPHLHTHVAVYGSGEMLFWASVGFLPAVPQVATGGKIATLP